MAHGLLTNLPGSMLVMVQRRESRSKLGCPSYFPAGTVNRPMTSLMVVYSSSSWLSQCLWQGGILVTLCSFQDYHKHGNQP